MAMFTSTRHSNNHQTSEQRRTLSPYSRLLIDLTNHISETEFSQMRMALSSDNKIKPKKLGSIGNIADLLEYMHIKKLIHSTDLQLLINLMELLKREDLKSKIEDYELVHFSSFYAGFDSGRRAVKCDEDVEKVALDEDGLPSSQESMKSLSDDEKVMRYGLSFPETDKEICLESEDVSMNCM